MEYSRYFQDLPSQGTQATLTQETKSLNSSTQAKPEEQLEEQHRQGAAVQPYPSDYIITPVALVQHCIAAEEQHRGAAGMQQQQGG